MKNQSVSPSDNGSVAADCNEEQPMQLKSKKRKSIHKKEAEGVITNAQSADQTSTEGLSTEEQINDTIVLRAISDISIAHDMKERWYECLDGPVVTIDASEVERIDTSVLQLLAAFVQRADAGNVEVHWKTPSDKLKYSAHLLGLEGALHLE